MTQLTCDKACGYIEFTAAPRAFIGDQCPECCAGHMTTDIITLAPTPCARCRAPLNPNSTGVCTKCNFPNWLHGLRIVRKEADHGRI